MDEAGTARLSSLATDFEAVNGTKFRHFFCPVLFRDEAAELCKGHIINQAFKDSDRTWTIQRKDVDGFFGHVESDFLTVQDRGAYDPIELLTNKDLSKRLRPQIVVDGRVVQHFVPNGSVPTQFSPVDVEAKRGTVRLALKLEPSETVALLDRGWDIRINKDLRVAALASLLKAAHLTLFSLLGYRYVLSAGGHFLGRDALGTFFLDNVGQPRAVVLKKAQDYFQQFANLVRPVQSAGTPLQGTITDRLLYLCTGADQRPWAGLVFVRTGSFLNAVLAPLFEEPEPAARFLRFLNDPSPRIEARLTRFQNDRWEVAKAPRLFEWPPTESAGAKPARGAV